MAILLLQIYFLFCFLILFYTIGYIFYQIYHKKYESRSVKQYMKIISKQSLTIQQFGVPEQEHVNWLSRRLKKVDQLIFFEKALTQLDGQANEIAAYLKFIEPVIIELTATYQGSNQMMQAYLAHFIARRSKGQWRAPIIYKRITAYLKEPTIYLRENVLLAACQQPDPKWIIEVLHFLTEHDLYHHPKLIQDGLLTYPFDAEKLIATLWRRHQTFQEPIVLGLIGYITIKSGDYKEVLFEKLTQDKIALEVKLQAMRYFKKNYYPKAEQELIRLISDKQDAIRIVAAFVLSSYSSEAVIASLKTALSDSNWHVRRNASLSLLAAAPSNKDISEVLTGSDRYAKEMLNYHLEVERR